MIFVFSMLSFKPTFSLSSFTFIKRLFSSSSLSAIRVVSSAYLRLLIFLPKASGGSRVEQLHVQGAVSAGAQEGLDELSHGEDQEGRW